MLSGALSSSFSDGGCSILLIPQTFNTCVRPPGRFFADNGGGGKGDLSDNLNAAAPSCWKFDQDASMISSVSELYLTPIICLFWVWDVFYIACRFWLRCHISKKSWTLAIPCNVLSSASCFNWKSFSVSAVSNAAQWLTNSALLAWANCLTWTISLSVSPVVLDSLQAITSRPWDELASTPTQWGTIENLSQATLGRSVYFECVSSWLHYQWVISGNQNVLLFSMWLEW